MAQVHVTTLLWHADQYLPPLATWNVFAPNVYKNVYGFVPE